MIRDAMFHSSQHSTKLAIRYFNWAVRQEDRRAIPLYIREAKKRFGPLNDAIFSRFAGVLVMEGDGRTHF